MMDNVKELTEEQKVYLKSFLLRLEWQLDVLHIDRISMEDGIFGLRYVKHKITSILHLGSYGPIDARDLNGLSPLYRSIPEHGIKN